MEHLAMMERILEARIPPKMALAALENEDLPEGICFGGDGRLCWPEQAPEEEAIDRVQALRPLREQISSEDKDFLALVQGLLQIDPRQRLPAGAALRSALFANGSAAQ